MSLAELSAPLGDAARERFASWDDELWRGAYAEAARRLEQGLVAARVPPERARALLASYLELAAEGIGRGYLYPPGSAAPGFLSLAWLEALPETLPRLPPERAAELVADCWNLGENLETSPVWLRRIFTRSLLERPDRDLSRLRELVTEVSSEALGEPERKLTRGARRHWIHLTPHDHWFLPGRVQFLAPAVVAVHDRLSAQSPQEETPAIGVWLRDPPVLLGPLGRLLPPASDPGLRTDLLEELARSDPSASDWHAMAANQWRAAVTLELSQYLVALLPE